MYHICCPGGSLVSGTSQLFCFIFWVQGCSFIFLIQLCKTVHIWECVKKLHWPFDIHYKLFWGIYELHKCCYCNLNVSAFHWKPISNFILCISWSEYKLKAFSGSEESAWQVQSFLFSPQLLTVTRTWIMNQTARTSLHCTCPSQHKWQFAGPRYKSHRQLAS